MHRVKGDGSLQLRQYIINIKGFQFYWTSSIAAISVVVLDLTIWDLRTAVTTADPNNELATFSYYNKGYGKSYY